MKRVRILSFLVHIKKYGKKHISGFGQTATSFET